MKIRSRHRDITISDIFRKVVQTQVLLSREKDTSDPIRKSSEGQA